MCFKFVQIRNLLLVFTSFMWYNYIINLFSVFGNYYVNTIPKISGQTSDILQICPFFTSPDKRMISRLILRYLGNLEGISKNGTVHCKCAACWLTTVVWSVVRYELWKSVTLNHPVSDALPYIILHYPHYILCPCVHINHFINVQ